MLFSSAKKVRTSELNYHIERCSCGVRVVKEEDIEEKQSPFLMEQAPSYDLSSHEKGCLNKGITNLILSTLRPYEIANEPFLTSLLEKALEIGAYRGFLAGRKLFFFGRLQQVDYSWWGQEELGPSV